MENLVNPTFWQGRRVLLTGHTGFKGAWLALWLTDMGALVYGYSLAPELPNSLFEQLCLNERLAGSVFADIRDRKQLCAVMQAAKPDIIFHLAAQALVPTGYLQPVETFSINVVGTAQVLECARECDSLAAIIVVTSDKCYENQEWSWGYRESDSMGGYDPYSASKGAAELVTASYRRSFLAAQGVAVASARAGNVIGGGDNSPSRLVPGAIAAFAKNMPLRLRNPFATRPWQHVLDPLHAYLQLAEHLCQPDGLGQRWAEAWNFGPSMEDVLTVEEVVQTLALLWPQPVQWSFDPPGVHHHEAQLLRLDCSKARGQLGWRPVWHGRAAVQKALQWHMSMGIHSSQASAVDVCRMQLLEFLQDSRALN